MLPTASLHRPSCIPLLYALRLRSVYPSSLCWPSPTAVEGCLPPCCGVLYPHFPGLMQPNLTCQPPPSDHLRALQWELYSNLKPTNPPYQQLVLGNKYATVHADTAGTLVVSLILFLTQSLIPRPASLYCSNKNAGMTLPKACDLSLARPGWAGSTFSF